MTKKLSFFFFTFLILFFTINIKVQGKDYYFKKVLTNIYINQDATFNVEIERTYNFSGSFSWGTYYIDKKGFNEISDFVIKDEMGELKKVSFETGEERTYTIQDLGHNYFIKFFYKAENEDRTFYFKYKVLGGIKAYLDIADFYWKVIEDKWERKTKYFECKIYFPYEIDENNFYIFAHGPLWGKIEKNNKHGVIISINNLPENTFVEARILFPANILNIEKIGEYKLNEILSYEKELANKANLERLKGKSILFTLISIPLIILIIWYFLFKRYGIEYKQLKDYLYIREPPSELPPSIVGYLLSWKNIDARDFTATLMDLIRKGYIKIETGEMEVGFIFKKTKNILYITKTDKNIENLKSYEMIIYNFLFNSLTYSDLFNLYFNKTLSKNFDAIFKGKSGFLPDLAGKSNITVSTEDINNFIKKNPQEFRAIFKAFSDEVKEEGKELGYFEETGFRIGIIFVVFSIIFATITIFYAIRNNLSYLIIYSFIISSLIFILSFFCQEDQKLVQKNLINGML